MRHRIIKKIHQIFLFFILIKLFLDDLKFILYDKNKQFLKTNH